MTNLAAKPLLDDYSTQNDPLQNRSLPAIQNRSRRTQAADRPFSEIDSFWPPLAWARASPAQFFEVENCAMSKHVPDSRFYVHSRCGETTEVDGGDFKNMASPVPGMVKTICSKCGQAFPVSEFQWQDTGEGIAAYYDRHRVRVPALPRLLCSRQFSVAILVIGFLCGIAFAVWSWSALGAVWGVIVGVFSSLVGAIASLVIWDRVTGRILSRSLGVPDVRCLK